jgi:hypothetical protein
VFPGGGWVGCFCTQRGDGVQGAHLEPEQCPWVWEVRALGSATFPANESQGVGQSPTLSHGSHMGEFMQGLQHWEAGTTGASGDSGAGQCLQLCRERVCILMTGVWFLVEPRSFLHKGLCS